ncbi:MAG: GNAT family N-acetyltransferase [Planctomycetota bacterium]|jgi:RimJ/RimL family protein N-acetyltransferase
MGKKSRHREALPSLVEAIREATPNGGIMLQGSVRDGTEREDSDIDITIVVPDDGVIAHNKFVNPENQGQMIRAFHRGIPIDINWFTHAQMTGIFRERGAHGFFLFSNGEILSDPLGLAEACQALAGKYFDEHPDIKEAWVRQHEAVRKSKTDPTVKLKHPKWQDFMASLRPLLGLDNPSPTGGRPKVPVVIRDTEERDLEALRTLWNNGEVMKYVGYPKGLGITEPEVQRWFQVLRNQNKKKHFVVLADKDSFCGELNYIVDAKNRSASLDIKLLPECQGKGVGFSAFTRLIEMVFQRESTIDTVWVEPHKENTKARNLYKKCGLVETTRPPFLSEGPSYFALRRDDLR